MITIREVSAENAVLSLNLLALQNGTEKQVADSGNKLVVPRILVYTASATNTSVTLPETPIDGTITVTGLTKTGVPDTSKVYEKDPTAASQGKYGLSGNTLTFPLDGSGDTVEEKIQVVYMYESEVATKVVAESDKFPKTCEFILSVLVCDACDTENLKHAYIVFPSFQMSPDYDLSVATDANHPFSGVAQQDYCGTEKQLYFISISEDIDEDAEA